MRYLFLSIVTCVIVSGNIAKASSIQHITSNTTKSNSVIKIKCEKCDSTEKRGKNNTTKATKTVKKDVINGKPVIITTDNFMGEEETYIKDASIYAEHKPKNPADKLKNNNDKDAITDTKTINNPKTDTKDANAETYKEN